MHSVGVLITHILSPCIAGAVTTEVDLGASVSKDLHNVQLVTGNDIMRLIRKVDQLLNSTISLMQLSLPCDTLVCSLSLCHNLILVQNTCTSRCTVEPPLTDILYRRHLIIQDKLLQSRLNLHYA